MKNFFDCKDEKITEQAFSQSLIISVVSILLCLVALCSMTYAWFTSETTSSSNTLTSGSFDVTVSVKKEDGSSVEPIDGKYILTLEEKYTVTLAPTQTATVKGYCIVNINGSSKKTAVILDEDMVDEIYMTKTAPLTFTIVTGKADTIVTFEPHWGVLVEPDIKKNANITVGESQIEIKYDDVTE